jgi:hypothetical protein
VRAVRFEHLKIEAGLTIFLRKNVRAVRFEHLKIEAGLTIFLEKKCPSFEGLFLIFSCNLIPVGVIWFC